MVYSLCSSSFCQGVKVVVVVQKDTHTFFSFSRARDFLLPGFLQSAVIVDYSSNILPCINMFARSSSERLNHELS